MFRFRVFSLLSILMLFGVSAYGRDSGTYTIKAVILDKTGAVVWSNDAVSPVWTVGNIGKGWRGGD